MPAALFLLCFIQLFVSVSLSLAFVIQLMRLILSESNSLQGTQLECISWQNHIFLVFCSGSFPNHVRGWCKENNLLSQVQPQFQFVVQQKAPQKGLLIKKQLEKNFVTNLVNWQQVSNMMGCKKSTTEKQSFSKVSLQKNAQFQIFFFSM